MMMILPTQISLVDTIAHLAKLTIELKIFRYLLQSLYRSNRVAAKEFKTSCFVFFLAAYVPIATVVFVWIYQHALTFDHCYRDYFKIMLSSIGFALTNRNMNIVTQVGLELRSLLQESVYEYGVSLLHQGDLYKNCEILHIFRGEVDTDWLLSWCFANVNLEILFWS